MEIKRAMHSRSVVGKISMDLKRHEVTVLVQGVGQEGELLEGPCSLDGDGLLSGREKPNESHTFPLFLIEGGIKV